MTHLTQIAKHFKDVHFGGNWTTVDLKTVLSDVTWQEAVTPVHGLNTIAALVFHMNYYVSAVLKVLEGGTLQASDKVSFDVPAITNEAAWRLLVDKALTEGDAFATAITTLHEPQLFEVFEKEAYGNYYRNLLGIIEHTHYHLGQIAVIKKILRDGK
ncbi:hypothetical protein LX64_02358 [Chitinophaga skermanii]|uniref:Damage-inducible protein DinB n=1 Tax=Chitinophaga skermanii TaxID=331697 RepID=A0A327QND5_9BACT|nr:DUF1572 domain-containing protein [Chitinophaga skermanii]RAJ05204.1 hypothetical protein LX64_02358 [Chitinophaga skermanii]